MQLGWLFTAYLITYMVFQLPGGIFGEWLGARKALVVTGLSALPQRWPRRWYRWC